MARRHSAKTRPKAGTRRPASRFARRDLTGPSPELSAPRRQPHGDEPEALVVTHWFDPGRDGAPYSATIRVIGRRRVQGTPKAGDSFVREEFIDRVVPGSGPVSISTWAYGLNPGDWDVDATVRRRPPPNDGLPGRPGSRVDAESLPRANWSWRPWTLGPSPSAPIRTRRALLAPLARIPGVVPGSFTTLAIVAIAVALLVQAALVAKAGVPVGATLLASLVAVALGLIAAKVWSLALNPGEAIVGPGWAVDGFLVGAPVVGIGMLVAFDLPIGTVLDATAPGLFFAVAIGRLGCFFTGCCAGRPTRNRLGIWSSDRRIGARRIPAQLLESASGVALGLVALLLVIGGPIVVPGAAFVVLATAYLAVRTALLRLRAEPRRFLWQRAARAPRPA